MAAPGLHEILHRTRTALATPSRNPRTAVVLGRLLGAAFIVCFLTGLYSHFLQDPLPWMVFPTRPVWLYQATQGTHIITGIVCFPLLLGKLYAVFPELFQSPPVRSVPHFLERASIAVFVSASLVEITIGLLNTYQFYALFPFSFRRLHFVLSFVIVGSLALHIAIKLPVITRYWRRRDAMVELATESETVPVAEPSRAVRGMTGTLFAWIDRVPSQPSGTAAATSRRSFFSTIGLAAGALVVLTAGQSIPFLRPFTLFAPRLPGTGPQDLPVNHTASSAGVLETAAAEDWVLTVRYGETSRTFTRAELAALPQVEEVIPLACVEGWSQSARWRGLRMRDLVDRVGAPEHATIRVRSLQERSAYTVMIMPREFVRDDATLIALELNGQILDLDHGYPARIICSSRPGVLQTKWLTSIEVLA
ncbi:MAG TPA: molybdopterin-dependent oxidoreductase [Plantibacter sp.]|uniref:molybdopterin-dependent oxidoreductase n=1 Tax=unclassified Plantibacter TaxID=2624265 RepID=UPI002CA9A410|nr:molybdopterin-dependent oxidoreductase [Plantibacter sp.]